MKFLERLTVKVKGWSLGKEIFVITGDSENEVREVHMEQFNNSPDAKVFFGSINACCEGISLVGASRIIILNVHLNPSVTRQAIGRAFRPGQVKKVFTYRLVASGSPEEEDHSTCFRKESVAKLWFEWNECCGPQDFQMETVVVKDCGDLFLETPSLNEDVISLYRRFTGDGIAVQNDHDVCLCVPSCICFCCIEQHYINKSRCIEAAGYVEKAYSSCRCDHRSMAKHISDSFFWKVNNHKVEGFN